MTIRPWNDISSIVLRIASTAARSAWLLSPCPIQWDAAMAAASVMRTSSRPGVRSITVRNASRKALRLAFADGTARGARAPDRGAARRERRARERDLAVQEPRQLRNANSRCGRGHPAALRAGRRRHEPFGV